MAVCWVVVPLADYMPLQPRRQLSSKKKHLHCTILDVMGGNKTSDTKNRSHQHGIEIINKQTEKCHIIYT